jgi:hypothetical protein
MHTNTGDTTYPRFSLNVVGCQPGCLLITGSDSVIPYGATLDWEGGVTVPPH